MFIELEHFHRRQRKKNCSVVLNASKQFQHQQYVDQTLVACQTWIILHHDNLLLVTQEPHLVGKFGHFRHSALNITHPIIFWPVRLDNQPLLGNIEKVVHFKNSMAVLSHKTKALALLLGIELSHWQIEQSLLPCMVSVNRQQHYINAWKLGIYFFCIAMQFCNIFLVCFIL